MRPEAEEGGRSIDIYIVGTGIVGVRQTTPEVAAAIRRCNEVFYLDPSPGIDAFLQQLCPVVTSLITEYKEGLTRAETYRRISARVFSAALEHPPVSLALYGHPLVFALPPFHLMALAGAYNLRVKVMPGISSLDAMFVDLNLDPGANGLQVYEATDLVLRQRPLQPDVPCFLLQIGTFGTSIFSMQPQPATRFGPLKEHLLRYYPPEHRIATVISSVHPLVKPSVVAFELSDLDTHAARLGADTLFIPMLSARPIVESNLRWRLADEERNQPLAKPAV